MYMYSLHVTALLSWLQNDGSTCTLKRSHFLHVREDNYSIWLKHQGKFPLSWSTENPYLHVYTHVHMYNIHTCTCKEKHSCTHVTVHTCTL